MISDSKRILIDSQEKILELARAGYTNQQICQYLGVGLTLFKKYFNENQSLKTALKNAKSIADINVENALYKRAIGYEYTEETIEYASGKSPEQSKIKTVKHIKKHIAGDVTAMIFWLKNRRPDIWRDRHDIEQKGEITDKIIFVPAEENEKKTDGQKD